MNQNTPQSDPRDVLAQDNVSDVLSLEENILLEKTFDEYFLYRTSEYMSEGSYDIIVEDFLEMIHDRLLPDSPLGRERTDLAGTLQVIESIFSQEKAALHNLQITITNNNEAHTYLNPLTIKDKSREGKKFDKTTEILSQFGNYYAYEGLSNIVDKKIIYNYITEDEGFSTELLLLTGNDKNINKKLDTIRERSKQLDEETFAQAKAITNPKIKQHTLLGLLINNKSDILSKLVFEELLEMQSQRENRDLTIRALVTFTPVLFMWEIDRLTIQQESTELKNDVLFTLLSSGNIRSFHGLLQYKELDIQKNYDTVIDFIERSPKRLFTSKSAKSTGNPLKFSVIAKRVTKENLYKTIRILASRKPTMLLEMKAEDVTCQFSDQEKFDLCETAFIKNPHHFGYNSERYYKACNLNEGAIALFDKKLAKVKNTYEQKMDIRIKKITQKYGLKEITYKDSFFILGFDEVKKTHKLDEFLANLEAQLYKYPPFVLQGKTVKIAETDSSFRGFDGIAPDKNTMVLDIDSPGIFDHELFHVKDREDGRRADNKIYKKHLSKKTKAKSHFSLAGRVNENQATLGEELFQDRILSSSNDFFSFLQITSFPEGERYKSKYVLPQQYKDLIREKMMKITDLDQLHEYSLIDSVLYSQLKQTTPEEAAKRIHKEETINQAIDRYNSKFQLIKRTEILTGCTIGMGKEEIIFKEPIDDRSKYGYKQETYPGGGPDHRAKRFGDKVTPDMRVKYFNSMADGTFNGRKKSQDGTREIIEIDYDYYE